MSVVFFSQLVGTHEEVVIVVSTEYLYYVQNLYKAEKMGLIFEITRSMYQASFLLSSAATRRGYVLVVGNPYKEMNTWKGKCEAVEQKCFDLYKDLDEMQKKVELVDYFQEAVETYSPLYSGCPDNWARNYS